MTTGNNKENPYSEYVPGQYSNPGAAEAPQGQDAAQQAASPAPADQNYSAPNYNQQPAQADYSSGYQQPAPYSANPYNAPAYGYQQDNKPKGLAIASLVLGILAVLSGWLIIGGLFGLVGLILGIVALVSANKGTTGGKGMAIAGIITSVLGILAAIVILVFSGWLVSRVGDCAKYQTDAEIEQCVNNRLGSDNAVNIERS
ncbi:MAG: DUF4190 domain-containing protein [Rothia sp. (in: high G+C Gram-positive bacteria)]|nr:DUF4190 domain-containing protein [Rothia sp. (in: high G+C Gram-positive bacteria)]